MRLPDAIRMEAWDGELVGLLLREILRLRGVLPLGNTDDVGPTLRFRDGRELGAKLMDGISDGRADGSSMFRDERPMDGTSDVRADGSSFFGDKVGSRVGPTLRFRDERVLGAKPMDVTSDGCTDGSSVF